MKTLMCGIMLFWFNVRCCHISGCLEIPAGKLLGVYATYFLLNSEKGFVELLEYDSNECCKVLNIDGILGLDFMEINQCWIGFNNGTLGIKGNEKQMAIDGFLGCFRMTASTQHSAKK